MAVQRQSSVVRVVTLSAPQGGRVRFVVEGAPEELDRSLREISTLERVQTFSKHDFIRAVEAQFNLRAVRVLGVGAEDALPAAFLLLARSADPEGWVSAVTDLVRSSTSEELRAILRSELLTELSSVCQEMLDRSGEGRVAAAAGLRALVPPEVGRALFTP